MEKIWNGVINSIRLFIKTKSFQETINRQFRWGWKNKILLDLGNIDHIVTKDGNKFYISKAINSVTQVKQDYIFDDIQKDDIVVVIGASIGAFSIPASYKAKKVCAIEPITIEELKRNIALNKRENIEAFEMALGDGEMAEITYVGIAKYVKTYPLGRIIEMCGGCDFLKMDCEGCEWNIKSEELKGIRRIEMEVHKVGFPLSKMKKILDNAGFRYEIQNRSEGNIGLWLVHAKRKLSG